MALTPDEAAAENDGKINELASNIETNIDELLREEWWSGASMVQIPVPIVESDNWHEEVLTEVLTRFSRAGWKIEKKHEPSEAWIFKKGK